MTMTQYPFIDIAVIEPVRASIAQGDAVLVLSLDLETLLWCNAGGLALLGGDNLDDALYSDPGFTMLQKRQLRALRGFPDLIADRSAILRFASQPSQALSLQLRQITLPDGAKALCMRGKVASAGPNAPDTPALLGTNGCHAAYISSNGMISKASSGFQAIGIERADLLAMIAEVATETDLLVKRPLKTESGLMPAALAKLTDNGEQHLLVIVEADASEDTLPVAQIDNEASHSSALVEAEPLKAQSEPVGFDDNGFAMKASLIADDVIADNDDVVETVSSPAHASEMIEEVAITEPTKVDIPSLRFVWKTDEHGLITEMSKPFLTATGFDDEAVIGTDFVALTKRFHMDPEGELAPLLSRHDTWSGRILFWPVHASDNEADAIQMAVPVELAGLPVFNREREFTGFRGFGTARFNRLQQHIIGIEDDIEDQSDDLAQSESDTDTAHGASANVIAFGRRPNIKIADETADQNEAEALAPADEGAANQDSANSPVHKGRLTEKENLAFQEIAARLKQSEPVEDSDAAESAQSNEQRLSDLAAAMDDDDTSDETHDIEIEDGVQMGDERPLIEDDNGFAGAIGADDEVFDHPHSVEQDDDTRSLDDIKKADALINALSDPFSNPMSGLLPFEGNHNTNEAINDETEYASTDEAQDADDEFEGAKNTEIEGDAPPAVLDDLRDYAVVDGRSFDKIEVPVLIHAGDTLHYANDAFLALSGYETLDDIIDHGGLDTLFVDPSGREQDQQDGVMLCDKSGDQHPVDAHLKSIRWQGGHALLLIVREKKSALSSHNTEDDLNNDEINAQAFLGGEQRANLGQDSNIQDLYAEPAISAEMMMMASEARLRIEELSSILDTATDGVVIIDSDGRIRSLNSSAEALFSYESADMAGQSFTQLFALESRKRAEDYLATLQDNGVGNVLNDGREMIGREREGRFIPLFITIGRLAHSSGYCAVLRDMTQWKQTEDALNTARREAETASSQKSQFLARISHEIRTPLNAIIGFSDLMLSEQFGPLGNGRYRDYMFDIHKSGNLVLQLVNDLLDIAKIEAGEESLNFEPITLERVLAEAVAILQPEANRQRVLIRSSFIHDAPKIMADERSVRQIALNLLSNAVRYTDSGGQVIISTFHDHESGELLFRIRDTGIGMSPSEIEEAMKPYRQISGTRGSKGGTGLGLPLTKAMVENNRARLNISSEPGVGTIVEIAFPPNRVLVE